jgi:hypothetical protein
MAVVTLDDFTFNRLIDWQELLLTPIPRRKVIKRDETPTAPRTKAPLHHAELFTWSPKEAILICRLSTQEKSDLYVLEEETAAHALREDGNFVDYYWIERIEVDYQIVECAEAPWYITIYMVKAEGETPPEWIDDDTNPCHYEFTEQWNFGPPENFDSLFYEPWDS